MYLEAKETARLYRLLTEKLGSDTAEAMFKYIDNKTERSVEATIKTLATKEDIVNLRNQTKDDIANLRDQTKDDIANLRKESGERTIKLHKEMANNQADNIKWMFIFWVGNIGATLAMILLFVKK